VAPPYFSQKIQMNESEYPRTYLNICLYNEISTINTQLTQFTHSSVLPSTLTW